MCGLVQSLIDGSDGIFQDNEFSTTIFFTIVNIIYCELYMIKIVSIIIFVKLMLLACDKTL